LSSILSAQNFIQALGYDVGLLIVGIILIVIGAIMPNFLPQGGKGWYALIVIGVIVVVIWLILLLLSLA